MVLVPEKKHVLPAIIERNQATEEIKQEKEKGKTPEGLLLSSNPTSSEIAEEEQYYIHLAQKRKDQ